MVVDQFAAHAGHEFIVSLRRAALENGVCLPIAANAVYNVAAVLKFLQHGIHGIDVVL